MRKPGFKLSEETKAKISLAKKGHIGFYKGKKFSEDHKKKISEALKGEKHPNWKGGITPKNVSIRFSPEYKLWRKAVFERDKYTCIWCGSSKSGTLQADHIKPFAYYPEIRFAIDNGRTLCKTCHMTTDTYGNTKKR